MRRWRSTAREKKSANDPCLMMFERNKSSASSDVVQESCATPQGKELRMSNVAGVRPAVGTVGKRRLIFTHKDTQTVRSSTGAKKHVVRTRRRTLADMRRDTGQGHAAGSQSCRRHERAGEGEDGLGSRVRIPSCPSRRASSFEAILNRGAACLVRTGATTVPTQALARREVGVARGAAVGIAACRRRRRRRSSGGTGGGGGPTRPL